MNTPTLVELIRDWTPPAIWRVLRKTRGAAFRESDRRLVKDTYLPWLCRVVGGWLEVDHGNLRAMDYAIQNMPTEGAVVEIGTFLGRSALAMSYLSYRHQRTNPIFICDPWNFEGTEEKIGGFFDAATPEYADYAREVFKLNIATFSTHNPAHAIEAFSDAFMSDWDSNKIVSDVFDNPIQLGGPIAFAYIDGAHTYEATRTDFESVHRHLLPGGFILFDDSARNSGFGSTQAALEVLRHSDYELVYTTPNYFFRRTSRS
jgi:hypothetical protein